MLFVGVENSRWIAAREALRDAVAERTGGIEGTCDAADEEVVVGARGIGIRCCCDRGLSRDGFTGTHNRMNDRAARPQDVGVG